jgi:hypothetical protein
MGVEDTFIKAIKTASKKSSSINVVTGVAKNIQTDKCDVFRDGMPTLYDVSLTAKDKTQSDFVKITPKNNSIVTVALPDGVTTDGVIIGHSEIEKVEIDLSNNKITIDNQGITMELQTGKFTVKNSSEDLKALINDLISACMAITIPLAPSGTGVPANVAQFQAIQPRLNLLFN